MNIKEFIALVENPPIRKGSSIFKVIVFEYESNNPPKLDIFEYSISYHLSFEEAEKNIRKVLRTKCKSNHLYGGYIYQHLIGDEASGQYEKCWVFNEKGESLCESLCSTSINGIINPFRGRSKEMARYLQGDIIEILNEDSNTAIPAIIYKVPPTPDMVWEKLCEKADKGKNGKNYFFDASTDSYSVIPLSFEKYDVGIKTSKVESIRIFPLHQELTEIQVKELREKLRNLKLSNFISDTFHADKFYGKNIGLRCDIWIPEKTISSECIVVMEYKNEFQPLIIKNDKLEIKGKAILSGDIITETIHWINKHKDSIMNYWKLEISSLELIKNIVLIEEIKDNSTISTLLSKDISRLYNMEVLHWWSGQLNQTIKNCELEIKEVIQNKLFLKEVCFILRFGIHPSVSIQMLKPLQEMGEYLENKNIVTNFAMIRSEKLVDSEFQLIMLIK